MTIIVQTIAPSSARDYNWLASAIGQYSGNRTDLGDKIADFVIFAEQRIRGDLQGHDQEMRLTLPVTNGAVSLPLDMIEVLSVTPQGGRPLDFLTPQQFDTRYADGGSGAPCHFKRIGSSLFLGPIPGNSLTVDLTYCAGLPALADAGGTNWLIQKHANLYLAACMIEGAIPYTKNWGDMPAWEKKYLDAMGSVNSLYWRSMPPMQVRPA